MNIEKVSVLTNEEIENITKETITLDASLFAHRSKISYLIDILTQEKKAIDKAILDKVEHKKVKEKLFYTIISDYNDFNKKQFESENPELYEKYKTLPIHKEQVRNK